MIAAVYGIGAILLWLFPMWTAHKLLPRTRFENTVSLPPLEAARVGCALIGLWFFSQGFLDAVWFLFRAFLVASSQSVADSLPPVIKVDLLVTIAKFAFGSVLIFQAGKFAKLVSASNE